MNVDDEGFQLVQGKGRWRKEAPVYVVLLSGYHFLPVYLGHARTPSGVWQMFRSLERVWRQDENLDAYMWMCAYCIEQRRIVWHWDGDRMLHRGDKEEDGLYGRCGDMTFWGQLVWYYDAFPGTFRDLILARAKLHPSWTGSLPRMDCPYDSSPEAPEEWELV